MVTLIFFLFFVAETCSAQCYESGQYQCCSGYEWNNMLRKCIKCKPGFYGINCSMTCLLPYYGEGCQQECVCSKEEECDISIGCQKKSTTTITTNTTTTAATTTKTTRFYTTGKRSITTYDHDNFKTSLNKATSDYTTLETTRLSTKESKLPDSTTALFNPKNMLFMAIFVVGLILVTLFIVYLFRMICKRCSARRDVKCYNKGECPRNRLPESIQYEEISNVLTLSVEDRYAPLQQINMDQYAKPLVGAQENEMKSETNIEHGTFFNDSSTVENPDISSDSSETGSTDSKGYQLPLSSVKALTGQLMTANLIVVADTDNNKNNGEYLTVLN